MKIVSSLAVVFFVVALAGVSACSSVDVNTYRDNQPTFDARQFFNGELSAHGVLKGRSGKVIRYFNATINAYWRDNVGVLEEDFIFDDGEKQRRVWTLNPDGEGRYIATAGDVVGDGIATVAGNSMFLQYVLRVPYNDGTIDLAIDDRMYLVSPTVLINESTMSKFGIKVGTILLVIEKR